VLDRARALMQEAGFTRFEILDIKSQVLAFLCTRP
jgi:hypothetical protein